MNTPPEKQPSAVPARAKRGGEVCARWAWTEPAVWTERMLTALEQGVKGGVWFSLNDKVSSSTAVGRRSGPWIAGCACGCGVFSASVRAERAVVGGGIISVGRTLLLPRSGTSPWKQPLRRRVNPLVGKTINWRAGCGRPARPVRREGEQANLLSLPLSRDASGGPGLSHRTGSPAGRAGRGAGRKRRAGT